MKPYIFDNAAELETAKCVYAAAHAQVRTWHTCSVRVGRGSMSDSPSASACWHGGS